MHRKLGAVSLNKVRKLMTDETTAKEDFVDLDWENRVLCSDESCIGVIGPDGRCKECGMVYEGELPASLTSEDDPEKTPVQDESKVEAEAPQQPETSSIDPPDEDDWDKRTLCSDESCIGVIGPDGRCKECGKPCKG